MFFVVVGFSRVVPRGDGGDEAKWLMKAKAVCVDGYDKRC